MSIDLDDESSNAWLYRIGKSSRPGGWTIEKLSESFEQPMQEWLVMLVGREAASAQLGVFPHLVLTGEPVVVFTPGFGGVALGEVVTLYQLASDVRWMIRLNIDKVVTTALLAEPLDVAWVESYYRPPDSREFL